MRPLRQAAGPAADAPATATAGRAGPRRGDLAAGDWRFLLPRLRYQSILHLGAPEAALLPLLAKMGGTLTIAAADARLLSDLGRFAAGHGIANLMLVCADPAWKLPFVDSHFDLVVAGACREPCGLLRFDGWLAELDRLLTATGLVYVETARVAQAAHIRRQIGRFEQFGFREPGILWLARHKGMLRLALPLGNHEIGRHCLDHLVVGVTPAGRALRQVARLLVRVRLLDHLHPQRGVLLERLNGTTEPVLPFPYVLDAVRDAGIAPPGAQIAFFAGADQNANKVTFLIFSGSAPRIVVKMPRATSYNARLENEHRTLSLLRERGAAEEGTYPDALFLRYHHGLALVGQSALQGTPFRHATTCRADCTHARAAMEWITALGERSARQHIAATAVAGELRGMLGRFTQIFPLSDREHGFLDRCFATLDRSTATVPLVFRHGDATPWNIIVGERDRLGVLDWEHAEARGLPLWDLFTFMQGFALWAGRVRGAHDDGNGFAAAFLQQTPFSRLHREATAAYCERIGVDPALVEPLFYACWMQRAMRAPDRIRKPPENTPFFRVLRMAIRERHALGLACMLD